MTSSCEKYNTSHFDLAITSRILHLYLDTKRHQVPKSSLIKSNGTHDRGER